MTPDTRSSRPSARTGRYTAWRRRSSSGPVLTVAVAALIFVVFRGKGDRTVSYSQVLSVMAHASVILAIRQIVAAPVSFARETTASATSLGVWFPALDQASPIARFVGALDVFVIWWVVLVALGVAVLYERQARRWPQRFWGSTPAWRCCSQRP